MSYPNVNGVASGHVTGGTISGVGNIFANTPMPPTSVDVRRAEGFEIVRAENGWLLFPSGWRSGYSDPFRSPGIHVFRSITDLSEWLVKNEAETKLGVAK